MLRGTPGRRSKVSGIISFWAGCVMLVICIGIGMFTIQLAFVAIAYAVTGVCWIWQKLTRREYPNEPRI